MKRVGAVDVLVNNAGIQHVAAVDEFPAEKWDAIIAINLSATFHATRLAIPAMKARHWGRIINIASAHGLVASPFKAPYVAAKHGVVGLHQGGRARGGRGRHHRQRDLPGLRADAARRRRRSPTRRARAGMTEDEVVQKVMLAEQPTRRFIDIERGRVAGGVPRVRRGARRSPARRCRSTAGGRRTSRPRHRKKTGPPRGPVSIPRRARQRAYARLYAEKLDPQPQVDCAFGFLITNCAPSRPSV